MGKNKLELFSLLVVLLGVVLRTFGVSGELWLDEIWNLDAVSPLSTPLEVYFGKNRLDGHSSIFSCLLFFFPQGLSDYVYRIPSYLFSITALILVMRFNTVDKKENTFFLLLLSTSYLLTLYGTEVRGYSGMILFLILSLLSWRNSHDKPNGYIWPAVFSIASCLALLFHYSFIMWYAAALLTDLLLLAASRSLPSLKKAISHGAVLIFIGLLYLSVLQYLPEGSGPRPSYLDTFMSALSVTLGGPVVSGETPDYVLITLLSALVALWIAISQLRKLYGNDRREFLLHLNCIFVSPLAVTLVLQPDVVLPRYFLTMSVMWLSLFASFLSTNKRPAFLRIICLSIFLSGNAALQYTLIAWGRGSYAQAIARIRNEQTTAKTPLITDHDFRHGLVLNYYAPEKFEIFDQDNLPEDLKGVEWYLMHTLDWAPQPKQSVTLPNGETFNKVDMIRATHLSGWNIVMYRNAN